MPVCLRSQPSCHASLKFAGYSNLLNGDILKMSNLKLLSSISNKFPDLVKHLHQQECVIANYGLNGGVGWLCGTNGKLCYSCKDEDEDCSHFFLYCEPFEADFSSLRQKLYSKILLSNPTDGTFICSFLRNPDQNNKILELLGGLPLPSEVEIFIMIRRFVSSAVGKICKLRTDKLRQLEAPWLTW